MDESRRVSVADLRRDLADVLNAAIQGEVTVITNRGRPVAIVGPLALTKTEERDDGGHRHA